MTATALFPLTWLYVPGDRPRVVTKALTSGADVVVIDLEDAVAPDRKEYARAATAELLTEPPPVPVHVRVNAVDGPLAAADLAAVTPRPGLAGLRLPKVTSPHQVIHIARQTEDAETGGAGHGARLGAGPEPAARPAAGPTRVSGPASGAGTGVACGVTVRPRAGAGPPLYALLETALAVEHAYAIASAHPALRGVSIGEADLRADLGVRQDAGLDWCRARVVVAARAAGLAPPAQSVHPDIRDLEGLAASCARGRALGFLGRAAIHPRQLPIIERAYLPTDRELEEAETIVEAATAEPGAQALADGRFVDAAVVAAARRTLALSRRC
ncbi:aldolase/citrate lyase family protein [Streptomyces sp. NPDC047017]|uniref:HpcH/HpaI aldolase/citrate lyase family protein n=1 Tax=Streptomyces sp. NPDC047017 TaxID=3155024 RepID=UPI0033E23A59